MKDWQPAKKRLCQSCGEWYWNRGAHLEACRGEPVASSKPRSSQLRELPGETFEEIFGGQPEIVDGQERGVHYADHLFACKIDESAGLREKTDA